MLTVTNHKGNKFNVVIVLENDSYGLEDCLTHDEAEPLIEFYDAEYANKGFDYRGQFIGRYYLNTLVSRAKGGLDLMGYEPKWKITQSNVESAVTFAFEQRILEAFARSQ